MDVLVLTVVGIWAVSIRENLVDIISALITWKAVVTLSEIGELELFI